MSAEVGHVDDALAGLYRLPLAEFVATRDQLARQLRSRRRPRERPLGGRLATLDQCLGGQPARPRRPNAMAELLDAGAALRQGQQDALAAGRMRPGGCGHRRPAPGGHHPAHWAGRDPAASAGHAASDPTLAWLAATLQAAATADETTRAALTEAAGWGPGSGRVRPPPHRPNRSCAGHGRTGGTPIITTTASA